MSKIITGLQLRNGENISLGDENIGGKRVEAITFRGDRHKTTGASYVHIYIVKFINDTVEMLVPFHSVSYALTDVKPPENDEDVGNVPDLPDALPAGEEE